LLIYYKNIQLEKAVNASVNKQQILVNKQRRWVDGDGRQYSGNTIQKAKLRFLLWLWLPIVRLKSLPAQQNDGFPILTFMDFRRLFVYPKAPSIDCRMERKRFADIYLYKA
jgi:hypothetical protein